MKNAVQSRLGLKENITRCHPRLQISGMTPLFSNCAFTLIELLVVVLIIGILAAVALPQYQKAVEKSRAVQALAILQTFAQAEEAYYLANGKYTARFNDLDVTFPPLPFGYSMSVGTTLDSQEIDSVGVSRYGEDEEYENKSVWFNHTFDTKQNLCVSFPDSDAEKLCKSFSSNQVACRGQDLEDGMVCYLL